MLTAANHKLSVYLNKPGLIIIDLIYPTVSEPAKVLLNRKASVNISSFDFSFKYIEVIMSSHHISS